MGITKVTDSASTWRDISPQDLRNERAAKIALVVGGSLVLIAMLVGIGFLATTTRVNVFSRIVSNAPFIPLVAVPGLAAALGLIIPAHCINHEYRGNGHNPPDDMSDEVAQNELRMILTSSDFKAFYDHYKDRSGGIGPLVRNELLGEEQGNILRGLFDDYHKHQATINRSTSYGCPKTREAIGRGEEPGPYANAKRAQQAIQEKWEVIQQSLTQKTNNQ